MKRIEDNYTVQSKHNVIGVLGPKASTFTLGWLTLHRKRFWTFMVGGRHLCLMLMFDRKGPADVKKSGEDISAMRQLIWGDGIKFIPPGEIPHGAVNAIAEWGFGYSDFSWRGLTHEERMKVRANAERALRRALERM